MAKTKPPYPAQFRQQIVELARVGTTPAELSKEFGPTAQSIVNWIAQDARGVGKPLPGKDGLSTAERQELVRLRRQLRQVQLERDILAKATPSNAVPLAALVRACRRDPRRPVGLPAYPLRSFWLKRWTPPARAHNSDSRTSRRNW